MSLILQDTNMKSFATYPFAAADPGIMRVWARLDVLPKLEAGS